MDQKALILMSTYNGGERIRRQIESIMNQKGIETHLLIRDDGSDLETVELLQHVCNIWEGRITCIYGTNIGWKRSFMELLFLSDINFDYYGFSDQDDLWFEDKISSCARKMLEDKYEGVKLSHCNCLSVSGTLELRKEQEIRSTYPLSHKSAIATEYFQGCGMLWNNEAMNLIRLYHPQDLCLAHDYWVGLICFFFGKIYFIESPQFFHIRYNNNSSEDGNVLRGRIKRINLFLSKSSPYMNPAKDLLRGYHDYLTDEDYRFCSMLANYKVNYKYRISLFLDWKFKRPSKAASILLKCAILLGRY